MHPERKATSSPIIELLSHFSLGAPRLAASSAARQPAGPTFYEAAFERAWDESPQSLVSGSLELAEQLLRNAERFANQGDLSAACVRARHALEGLTIIPEGEAPTDDALRALRERASHDLGLYEAQRAKGGRTGHGAQHSASATPRRPALKKVD